MATDTDVYSAVVNASSEDIIATILDFESYTEWQGGVLECTVKERDDDGRGSLIEMFVDAKIRKIRYVVRYFWDLDNGRFGWDYVSGDLKECTGRYQLMPDESGGTTVAMDIETEIGFFVPGPMKKLIRDQAIKNSMRDLKKRVEK